MMLLRRLITWLMRATWCLRASLGLLTLLCAGVLQAQSLTFDPTAGNIDLVKASYVLEDPDGQLTLEQVQSPAMLARFASGSPRIGYTTSAHWLRFTLSNPGNTAYTRWFDSGNWTLEEVEFYAPGADGRYQRQATGSLQTYVERPLPTGNYVFPFVLPAQKTIDVFLRVRSLGHHGVFLKPGLWQAGAYQAEEAQRKMYWFLYLGIAAALGLFNFLLFCALREAHYLRYVLAVIGVVMVVSTYSTSYGYAFEYFWPRAPVLMQIASLVAGVLNAVFTILFSRLFIDENNSLPRLYRTVDITLWAQGILCMIIAIAEGLHLTQYAHEQQLLFVIIHPITWVMMLTAISGNLIHAWRGNRRAKFITLAWTPLLFAWMESFISPMLGNYISRTFLMWASAIELILMALALADRINQEKKEKEQAQAALVEGLRRSEQELEEKVVQRTEELRDEQARAAQLLHNILPVEVAAELSATGYARPLRHESVTIIFADFSGFTQAASAMPADRMVAELNEIFAAFDDITDACGVEKIKTIGDAYMAVAGLPKPCADHASRCVRAGLHMLEFLAQRNLTKPFKWSLRVGLHSGPVVAGIVGKRKYAYDIWGDTVNIASRIESSGEAGRVNISAYTYDLIQKEFACTYRGKVEAKGKGEIDMYFVVNAEVLALPD